MNEVLSLSALEQACLIRERRIGSLELIDAHLARIEAINPSINAATEVLSECARAAARAADRSAPAGPLHGVPFSIKDSIEVAGTSCTAGTTGRRGASISTTDAR